MTKFWKGEIAFLLIMFFFPFIFPLICHQILKETEYHLSEIHVPGSLVAVNYFFKKCKCVSISEIEVKWEETWNNSKSCPEPQRHLSHHRPPHFSCLGGKTLARIIFELGQSKCWKDDFIYFVSLSHQLWRATPAKQPEVNSNLGKRSQWQTSC